MSTWETTNQVWPSVWSEVGWNGRTIYGWLAACLPATPRFCKDETALGLYYIQIFFPPSPPWTKQKQESSYKFWYGYYVIGGGDRETPLTRLLVWPPVWYFDICKRKPNQIFQLLLLPYEQKQESSVCFRFVVLTGQIPNSRYVGWNLIM